VRERTCGLHNRGKMRPSKNQIIKVTKGDLVKKYYPRTKSRSWEPYWLEG